MADSQQAISLPSLILVAAIGAAALRYFFYSPSDSASRTSSSASRPVNQQHVDQVASMFPQLPRRDIIWDLQRNGGNVAATTERVLSNGRLDTPPVTFQPIIPSPSTSTSSSSSYSRSNHLDLIEKYNLSERLKEPPPPSEDSSKAQGTWSADRKERQSILQRRRDEMILNARRKMQEKDKAKNEDT